MANTRTPTNSHGKRHYKQTHVHESTHLQAKNTKHVQLNTRT